MRSKKNWWLRFGMGAVVAGLLLFTWGCEKTTTEPKPPELQLSKAATEGLTAGWQSTRALLTVNEMSSLVKGEAGEQQTEVQGIYSKKQLKQEVHKLTHNMQQVLKEHPTENAKGDSLLWFIDWTDPVTGMSVRKALYYNTDTGHARYYETIYRFPAQVQINYDSTEIRADLNFTLNDSTDDQFLSLFKFTRFKEAFQVDSLRASAVATDWDEHNEVTGGVLTNEVWYGAQIELSKLFQQVEFHPDESGHLAERLDYRDGTFLQKEVNFYSDYTGDFSEVWRDGTTVTGTFDRIEDDNHASVTRTVQFPTGYDPTRIEQLVDITLNPVDSTGSISMRERVYFANGDLDTARVDVSEYYENGILQTHLQTWNSDGSRSDLLVSHYAAYDELNGNFTTVEGYYGIIHAFFYPDESGEIWLDIYESEQAYLNGDPPVLSIYIHIFPDGSGEGKITENNKEYQVTVKSNGQMVVKDSRGNETTVNAF